GCGLRAGWSCSRSLPLPRFFSSRNTGRMSSACSHTCCFSCVPCCICSCTAGTAMDTPTTRHISLGHHEEGRNALGYPCLWPLVARHTQCGGVHHFRVQFYASAQCT